MEEKLCILTTVGLEQFLRGILCLPKDSKPATTRIIKNSIERRVHCTKPFECVDFSEREMEQYLLFLSKNPILRSIGFNDGSALYYGMTSKKIILVPDMATLNLCKMFNIPYIYLLPLGINFQTAMKESPSKDTMEYNRDFISLQVTKNNCNSNGLAQNNKSMTG